MPISDRQTWFCSANPRSSASTCCSPRGEGTVSDPCSRMSDGTVASTSASNDGRLSTASISWMSDSVGPIWRGTNVSFDSRKLGCGMGGEILLKVGALVHSKHREVTYHAGPSFPSIRLQSLHLVFRNVLR